MLSNPIPLAGSQTPSPNHYTILTHTLSSQLYPRAQRYSSDVTLSYQSVDRHCACVLGIFSGFF